MPCYEGAIAVKNKHFNQDNEMRSAFCVANMISREEITQVYGYILIFDFTGFTMKHVKASWSSENSKNSSKVWQVCVVGRFYQYLELLRRLRTSK